MSALAQNIRKLVSVNKGVKTHAPVEYRKLIRKLKTTERERQDVLHILELDKNLTDEDYITLAKTLAEISLRRREIKDALMYYKELIQLLKDEIPLNKRVIREQISKVTEEMKARVYYIRERTDLTKYIRGNIVCQEAS